jgi:hypothetical protein
MPIKEALYIASVSLLTSSSLIDMVSSSPSTVATIPSNLYDGGKKLNEQPSSLPIAAETIGQMYKERFSNEELAVEGCKKSVSCRNNKEHCRAVGYVRAQIRCDQTNHGSTTTMLCEESPACAKNPNIKCMHTFECETESPLFDRSTTWNNNNHANVGSTTTEQPRFKTKTATRLRGPLTDVLHLHSAGDVLNKHKKWPPVEAEAYANKLLVKSRLNIIGSTSEKLPQADLYESEQKALEQCVGSKKCKNIGQKCEAKEIVAERIGSDNSMFTYRCASPGAEEAEEGEMKHELNGFDERTGMPLWNGDGGAASRSTSTKSTFGIGIRPSPTSEHPLNLKNQKLSDPNKEKGKISIFTPQQ